MGSIFAILALVGESLLFVISGTRRDKDAHERMQMEEKGKVSPFGEAATPAHKISVEKTIVDNVQLPVATQ